MPSLAHSQLRLRASWFMAALLMAYTLPARLAVGPPAGAARRRAAQRAAGCWLLAALCHASAQVAQARARARAGAGAGGKAGVGAPATEDTITMEPLPVALSMGWHSWQRV
jgi:hypothetical protein